MQDLFGIIKELPVVVALLEGSPLVLLTLNSIAALAVVGLALVLLGKK